MRGLLLLAILLGSMVCFTPMTSNAQQFGGNPVTVSVDDVPLLAGEREGNFRRSLIKACRQAVSDGTISRRESAQLRIAALSPKFRGVAQNLFLVELSFSGANVDDLPRKTNGEIDSENVNWESFLAMLIEFLPILLNLLTDFGIIGGGS